MTEPSRSNLHLHYPGSRFSTLVHHGKREAHISYHITCAGRNALHTHPLIQHYFWAIKANDLLALTVNLQWLFDHELKNNTKLPHQKSWSYQDQNVSSVWPFLSLVLCILYKVFTWRHVIKMSTCNYIPDWIVSFDLCFVLCKGLSCRFSETAVLW